MKNILKYYREETRVEPPFVVRFRNVTPLAKHGWDITSIKNISKSGIMFNVFQHHKTFSELELRIKIPILRNESVLWARVVRCSNLELDGMYKLAATLWTGHEETRAVFNKMMDSLIEKKKRSNADKQLQNH